MRTDSTANSTKWVESQEMKIRPREHIRDDVGHSSMQKRWIAIESDTRERHASGKRKKIKGHMTRGFSTI